jgi:hypothetical protein
MLGGIIRGMGSILKFAAKPVKYVFGTPGRLASSMGKKLNGNLGGFGKWISANPKTAKWFAGAAKYLRKSGILGQAGAIGDTLRKSGVNSWYTKGLSAFKYDSRSPKEFAKYIEAKNREIKILRKRRDEKVDKALKVQDELSKTPISIANIPSVEGKLDTLAGSLSAMKSGIGDIRSKQNATYGKIEGFSLDQAQANDNISDLILQTSEGSVKIQLDGYQDIKNHNAATQTQTAETITTNISSKLDAMEDERKAEEEERIKNDWKRKLFEKILLVLEWVLDFPGKIRDLLFKVGLVLFALIAGLIAKHWGVISPYFDSLMGAVKALTGRLTSMWWTFMSWLNTLADFLLGLFYKAIGEIVSVFSKSAAQPFLDAETKYSADKSTLEGKIEEANAWVEDGYQQEMEGQDGVVAQFSGEDSVNSKQAAINTESTKIDIRDPKKGMVDISSLVGEGTNKKPEATKDKLEVPDAKPDFKDPKAVKVNPNVSSGSWGDDDLVESYIPGKYNPKIVATRLNMDKTTGKTVDNAAKATYHENNDKAINDKIKGDAVGTKQFEANVNQLMKNQEVIINNVKAGAQATIKAAATKEPNVVKNEMNFTKTSNEITPLI